MKIYSPYTKLAKATGLSYSVYQKIAQRKIKPHPDHAKRLEALTGVDKLLWLYPEDYGDPFESWEREGYLLREIAGPPVDLDLR